MADLPPGKGGGPSVRKALRVPNELEERVNAARGDVSWSRWVLRAVEQRLEREGAREPLPPLSAAEKAAVANIGEQFPRADDRPPSLELAGRWCCTTR